jgi:phosphoribosylanthranilate isomerase
MTAAIKICGLRRAADAELALQLGATHLGCVVAADSPRCATADEVRAVRAVAAGGATFVLVCRGRRDEVLAAAAAAGPDLVQWHGAAPADETALAAAGHRLLRVRTLAAGATALPPLPPATIASPLLLDVGRGGGGQQFDWNLLGTAAPAHVFIAGGITPANVGALLAHRPWGIDLSSGVESAPGRKDHAALRRLFAALQGANA